MEDRGDGELKLAAIRAGGGGVLEVRGGELARELGDWDVGVPLVLKHMRVGEPGLFPELATAAAMWRPTGASGVRGRSGEGPARGEKGGEEPGHDAWKATASSRRPAALPRQWAAPLCPGGRGSREGERRKTQAGPVCNFKKV